ncbi:MAG: UDP-N-acetylmuramoyl-tripeptide--D-alanyl-D-alanine ligase [Wenzhouxiangellaceae bacterium]|nr:UDP-N-acetylmuramoyl-tripeptide--D-alanyl-D-alanine ligase [Wenzhouxiangellaceae bacterium]
MIRFDLERAAELTGGTLHPAGPGTVAGEFHGMTQDTRNLKPGNLFAALVGTRVDGHIYVAEAAARGAAAALVATRVDAPIAQIEVADVVRALGDLARAWRADSRVRLVGITGSNGKTMVKTMLSAILSRTAPTLATRGNCNNEIGVPLTLAALGPHHRFAVVEMGAGQPGDIEYLASIAAPEVGVVTNAGPAHLERLGSIEGVAKTKGELFVALGSDGTAIINYDDDFCEYWKSLCRDARQITFGTMDAADVRLVDDGDGESVDTPAGRFRLRLNLPGRHNRLNALAAAAAALALEMPLEAIAAGLASVAALAGRLDEHEMEGGWRLIDDSYNANPASLYAALEVLAEHSGERWLVIGDMAELGESSDKLHREIGRAAREFRVDRLFAIGRHAAAAADAFGRGAETFDSMDGLIERLGDEVRPGVACLVKGSRSMNMDRIVSRLRAAEVDRC